MTTSPVSVRLGAQEPRLHSVPPYVSSAGAEAVELAESAGLLLDPWQKYVLEHSLGEVAGGAWAAFEVALLVGRQNGKGSILEARELAGLFLFDDQLIMHSAHEFKTSTEAFIRLTRLIESTPDLDSKVMRVSRSHGDEGIELRSGSRIKFVARTGGSGRGFSADCVVLDEAFNLPEAAMSSLLPTLSARKNPQVWYTSSAVNRNEHHNGRVLARVRARGMAGGDPSLAFFEWSVDEDEYRSAPESVAASAVAWAQANPGLGIRISEEHVERERRSLTAEAFAVERLGVGNWPDDEDVISVIPADVWAPLADTASQIDGPVTFAVDVAPDRSSSSVCAAGARADGLSHVEVIDHKSGTGWLVDRLTSLVERHGGELVIDPGSPAGSLIPELERAGVPLRLMRTRDVVAGCGQFYDAAVNDRLRHLDQGSLTDALAGARKRDVAGGGWAWSRKDVRIDITPLVAATNALWGAGTTEAPPEIFAY